MSDNKTNIGNPDKNQISLAEKYEVEYWAKKFNVSHDQLKDAVKSVGHSAKNVEEYFNQRSA